MASGDPEAISIAYQTGWILLRPEVTCAACSSMPATATTGRPVWDRRCSAASMLAIVLLAVGDLRRPRASCAQVWRPAATPR